MKKGFTLIELLAVITILSLVALITSISVANMLKESKDDLSDAQMKSIKAAAEAWGADNISELPTGSECAYITLLDLKNDGLLDSDITNPKDKKEISNELKIKINSKTRGTGKSVITYEVNSTNIQNCVYIGGTIYVDVPKGLTPVMYDEEKESWVVANPDSDFWYDYDNQKWANAVKLVRNKKPGEKVKMNGNDAILMFVYIPRYEYKIEDTYGKNGESASNPGEIDIKFINNSKTTADNGYTIHPSFTFGYNEINGFWVGKFELSSVSTNTGDNNNLGCTDLECTSAIAKLRILPNKSSLRNNDISNFFYAIKRMETGFVFKNFDTHMIKNSEWAAVAYLSQSKYGKYRNDDYEDEKREIYQNKSSEYLTGSSNGTPSNSDSYTQCTYDQKAGTNENQDQNNCGPGASTTGNIYGVYDMSGGSNEFVMGAYGSAGNPTIASSGFNTDPNVFTNDIINFKYYDIYLTDNVMTACKYEGENVPCYGHALSETKGWYNDMNNMVTSNTSWLLRGGGITNSNNSGIFHYHSVDGANSNIYNYSTRVVGVVDY